MKATSLTTLDHYVSEYILTYDNALTSWILLPFSTLFHPKMIWVPLLVIYLLSGRSLLESAYYGLCMLITLTVSTFLKRNLKRQRPLLREKVRKFKHFRQKEKNFSIPSGDTVQAVLFAVFLNQCYGVHWVIAFGVVVLVAVSRVYFMCHWVGDTIFAMLIEYPIAVGLVQLKSPVVSLVTRLLARG